jgi:hypothetical protein
MSISVHKFVGNLGNCYFTFMFSQLQVSEQQFELA